jgi:predicted DCC family thiol-disulfide oxidoreductase YuxK
MTETVNENPRAEQSREYLWLHQATAKFPRLRRTLLALFAIDLRTLALTRIVMAAILLVELITRLPDLKAFYSDEGVAPRVPVYQILPNSWFVSLHFLSGRVEVEAVMFVIAGIFGLLLLLGYKTRLMSFLSWLLFSSLCLRNPFVVHGGDSLLKMMLFWGMFVPWGARFSVDSALNPHPRSLPKEVFSVGTMALLLQMPFVYFFGGILKNGIEWRHDFTAIMYSLKAPDYVLPVGLWLTSYPGILKALTVSTLILEIAGGLLLFCPFRTKTVRFYIILALCCLQLGLALTLQLGLFPLVSIAAVLPFIPGSFWDRIFKRLRTPQRTGLRIYYDANCGFCRKSLRLLKTFFLLPETEATAAQDDATIEKEMIERNSWVVIDHGGQRYYKFDALIQVIQVSPLLWPLAYVLRLSFFSAIGTRFYEWIANSRGLLTKLTGGLQYKRLTVRQPLWLTLACAICLTYVVIDNMGSIARSPVRIPSKLASIGQLLNIHQDWRMFAPSPRRVYTWYVVTGKHVDGREFDLWSGGTPRWDKSIEPPAWVKDYRWRTYMRYIANDRQRLLRPYFANYICREWDKKHGPGDAVMSLTFHRLDEPISLDGSPQETSTTLLLQHDCSQTGEAEFIESN